MLNPRDIVFVVDTSGSMNDDTEPQWATKTINGLYGPSGYPNVATELIQDLYADLNFGSYPGALEHIGQTLGVPSDYYAYAEMTKDDGALADASIAATYRILPTDDEATRRVKAYSWIIDNQIARLMPNARPIPNSQTNYGFWEKYIDYVITYVGVGTAPPPPPDEGGGGGGGVEEAVVRAILLPRHHLSAAGLARPRSMPATELWLRLSRLSRRWLGTFLTPAAVPSRRSASGLDTPHICSCELRRRQFLGLQQPKHVYVLISRLDRYVRRDGQDRLPDLRTVPAGLRT